MSDVNRAAYWQTQCKLKEKQLQQHHDEIINCINDRKAVESQRDKYRAALEQILRLGGFSNTGHVAREALNIAREAVDD